METGLNFKGIPSLSFPPLSFLLSHSFPRTCSWGPSNDDDSPNPAPWGGHRNPLWLEEEAGPWWATGVTFLGPIGGQKRGLGEV
jgi:hypothetical protein